LNTVERRKIRSGSSAAKADETGHASHATNNKHRIFSRVSHGLETGDVMEDSEWEGERHVRTQTRLRKASR
jgi:hypothetical protein